MRVFGTTALIVFRRAIPQLDEPGSARSEGCGR